MQMISQLTYQQLKCPSVIITQHTFDLETLTYYIANYLCSMHNKKYVFFYDWAYAPVNVCICKPKGKTKFRTCVFLSFIHQVCPLSSHLTSALIVRFAAFELKSQQSVNSKQCANCCGNNQSIDCVFHRKNYECSALFTWNIDTGDWHVLDYGDLVEVSPATIYKHSNDLNNAVKQLASELLTTSINENDSHSDRDIFSNLRILDSCTDKSKEVLTDYENSIEFIRSAKNHTQYFNVFSSASDY